MSVSVKSTSVKSTSVKRPTVCAVLALPFAIALQNGVAQTDQCVFDQSDTSRQCFRAGRHTRAGCCHRR